MDVGIKNGRHLLLPTLSRVVCSAPHLHVQMLVRTPDVLVQNVKPVAEAFAHVRGQLLAGIQASDILDAQIDCGTRIMGGIFRMARKIVCAGDYRKKGIIFHGILKSFDDDDNRRIDFRTQGRHIDPGFGDGDVPGYPVGDSFFPVPLPINEAFLPNVPLGLFNGILQKGKIVGIAFDHKENRRAYQQKRQQKQKHLHGDDHDDKHDDDAEKCPQKRKHIYKILSVFVKI